MPRALRPVKGAKQQELDTLQGGEVQVALQERHKYMLLLTLRSPMALGVIPDLCLTLRLYLDARVAEVIGYQGVEFIPPRYLVSPRRGELRDERQQLNRMLFELLRICRPVVLPLPYSSKPPHS